VPELGAKVANVAVPPVPSVPPTPEIAVGEEVPLADQ
jgi:hypothetical protein